MAKERKSVNVSLQSKKYLEPVNKILNEWEEESLNLSTQICENILLLDQLKKSSTFVNILTVYELIEKMMKIYNVQEKQQLERIFSEVVMIDNGRLSQILSQFNTGMETPVSRKRKAKQQAETETITTRPVETVPPKEVVEDVDTEVIAEDAKLKQPVSERIVEEPVVEKTVEFKNDTKREEVVEEIQNSDTEEETAVFEDDMPEIPLDFLLNG